MNTRLVSQKALSVIDQYLHFHFDKAATNIPYYNNCHKAVRGGLRGAVGKGSPRDIFDETDIAMSHQKKSGTIRGGSFVPDTLSDEALKHFLVDNGIGIDCSGFIYYVLNAEYGANGKGSLDRHLKFPYAKGILGKLRAEMRPAENAGVTTFAHEKNSHAVTLTDVKPADIIGMIENNEGNEKNIDKNNHTIRDHILFIHQIDYQNFVPTALYYSHSVAWPSDGKYGNGVRQGKIEILDIHKPLTEQKWIENEKIGTKSAGEAHEASEMSENYTFVHAVKARTEIRRMVSL
jgi:hypothetical protein